MSVNKYKVGDRVRIKSIEEMKNISNSEVVNNTLILPDGYWGKNMNKFCGRSGVIIKLVGDNNKRYNLDITDMYYFSESMLESFHILDIKEEFKFNEDLL